MKTGQLVLTFINVLNVGVRSRKMEVVLIWIVICVNINGAGYVVLKAKIGSIIFNFLMVLFVKRSILQLGETEKDVGSYFRISLLSVLCF